jgi:CubicO group peptidase (beta-lactamase class C family)
MLLQNGTYNNQQILNAESVQKIFKNQIGQTFIVHSIAPAGNVKWGLGCAVGDESLSPAPLDDTTAHWAGAFGGWWYVDYASKTSFVLNSNILPAISYQPLVNNIVAATA